MTDKVSEHWPALGDKVQQTMAEKQVPGVAMGILYDGQTVSEGFGVTNLDHPLPVTADTLFQIGSISKTFSGTLLMRLVEQGKLDLDAPLRTYLPDFKVQDEQVAAQVTARHLLTHTSGWAGDLFIDTGEGEDALEKYVSRMANQAQIAPLGAHFSYNNAGFFLVGYLIEKLAGKPYPQILRESLFEPLGLENACLTAGEVITRSFAVGHHRVQGEVMVARPWGMPRAVNPVGGLIMNVPEILRYAQFQMGDGRIPGAKNGDRILAAESLAAMQTPAVTVWEQDSWGLSWKVSQADGLRLVSHGGGTNGQVSTLLFVPERQFALAVVTNADLGGFVTDEVTRLALELFLGVKLPRPEPIETSLEDLYAFSGRYARPFMEIELGVLGGRLIGQVTYKAGFPDENQPPPPSPPPMTLAPCAPDRLIVLDGDYKNATGDIIRTADGQIGWLRFGSRLNARR